MFNLNFTQMRKKLLLPFTHWRKAQRVLLLLVGVLGVMLPTSAQTPVYSNDFSTSALFNAMTVVDANNDGSTWSRNSGGYAEYHYSSSNVANDWLITPGITLEAGKTYQFDIEAWARSTTYPERLEVKLGTAATAAGMTTDVIASTNITSTSHVTLTNNTVTVASTGVYYFGVHAISNKDMFYLYVDNLLITNVTPAVPKPTNLVASNVVYNGATLTWTAGGDETAWQVIYGTGNFDPSTATPIDVTGNATYTITGLTENTTYTAYVRGNCGSGDVSSWSDACTFTTPERYARPTDLAVSDITAHSAKATWNGDADSYNLRYRKVLGYNQTFFESFENSFPGSWTIIDSDGDGKNWTQFNPQNFSNSPFDAYDGSYGAMSRSWQSTALTPDNWLISPQVDLGGVLKYYIVDDGGYQETYRIYVSTTGTNIADFQPITDDLLSPASNTWTERTADLTSFEGQRGYIAFRQYNSTDMDFMIIDAVSIEAMTYGDWVEVDDVTNPYTITGLDAETDYVVQVQGVYDEGNSGWSNSVLFTTVGADAMPFNLTVTDVTDCTAMVNWNGSQDSYNLRYRNYDFFEDFANGLPSDWTTINNDGDNYNWSKQQFTPSCISSASYINDVGALTPDNWLITPAVPLDGILSFDAWGQDANDFAEVFKVYVSTSGNSINDFVEISQDITTTHNQTTYSFDLSQYAGQDGYIAIRHYNCTNMYWLNVTNFSIGGEWVTINDVTSPYTITSLEPETDYEVQVQGVYDGGTTDWTESEYFTTLEAVSRPMTLAALVADGEVGIRYTISEPLLVVRSNGNSIWLKDADGSSILKTSPAEGYQNYAIVWEGNPHENQADYDQSNWIEVQLADGSEDVVNLVGNRIKADKITGTFSNKTNPTMTGVTLVEGDYEITAGEDEYMLNYYCTANFDGSQPATIGTGAGTNYFFMNPKPQECAFIIWAKYDAASGKMIMPSTSEGNGHGFHGEFEVDLSLNIGTSPEDGKTYNFDAIVRMIEPTGGNMLRENNSNGYIVYPLNLSEPVVTGINDVTGKAVAGVKYYNVTGIESDRPFDGVNIIVTTYTDGSRSSAKVLK